MSREVPFSIEYLKKLPPVMFGKTYTVKFKKDQTPEQIEEEIKRICKERNVEWKSEETLDQENQEQTRI